MASALWSLFITTLCWRGALSSLSYRIHMLESSSMCGTVESASIFIRPWSAAILKMGYRVDSYGNQLSRGIHKCKVKINTQKGFGLTAVIEDMVIRGTRNKETNGWQCEDYVKLSSAGSSFITKFLDDLLPGDLFKSKTTEELCGTQHNGGPDNVPARLSYVGSNANILSTLADTLDVEFHQSTKNPPSIRNNFTIVVTTFKHENEKVFADSCAGKYQCRGSNTYCIDPRYQCDGHINCAFPDGGSDEQNCKVSREQQPVFSTTTTIITTLAGIVGAGLVVCCVFTLAMRIKSSRHSTPSQTPVPPVHSPQYPSAPPPLQRQHTLPQYEAVVMGDLAPGWKNDVVPAPAPGECPPSYTSLFPDGPPKDVQVEGPKDAANS